MEGPLLDRLKLKFATNVTQPLLNLRVPPIAWRRLGSAREHAVSADGVVTILCQRGGLEITGITPRIWRVVVDARLDETGYRSESVICEERMPLAAERSEAGKLRVACAAPGGLEAVVDLYTAGLSFRADGRPLHVDACPPRFSGGWVACRKRAPEAELYLGFGEKTGPLARNGRRLVMWNTDNADMNPRSDPIYQSCPLQVALRRDGTAHALFFDNPHYSVFRVGGSGTQPETRYLAAGGPLVYYVLAGPTLPEVLEQLNRLTGRSPLPPAWVLGHHHSRWDPEESQDKVLDTAREFRRRGIPCDVVHLDIGHMEGYRCFTWNRERFPDPQGLIRALHEEGFRVIVIVDPGIKRDPGFALYREGCEQGLFCTNRRGQVHHSPVWPGQAAFPDFTAPEARKWWGRLFGRYVEKGVDGFWIDMNEPSVFTPARTLTSRVRHRSDRPRQPAPPDGLSHQTASSGGPSHQPASSGGPSHQSASLDHRSVHNLYGFLMAKATYEGLRSLAPERRPYLFTRAAFTGIQRYAGSWTGDNRSSWEHLRMSIPMLLSMGLSGQALVGPDIGGFLERSTPELMARWLELGALYPFCRNHTSHWSLPQEIWCFGAEVEAVGRRYLRLRYSLLPYLYTLAWEASRSGAPILRPLLYEFPGDAACRNPATADSQLMLGPHLLAAPVLAPGERARAVYLPPADYWEDWWSGRRLAGGRQIEAEAPLERLPLYVRAGAALPLSDPARNSAEAARLPIRWRVYPTERFEGCLYLDDGESMSYERNDYSLLRLRGAQGPHGGRMRIEREAGRLEPLLAAHPTLTVELSGEPRQAAAVDPRRLPWEWTYPG